MFGLTILEKIKETIVKFFQGKATVLWKMANYEEARVKLLTKSWLKVVLPKLVTKVTLSVLDYCERNEP